MDCRLQLFRFSSNRRQERVRSCQVFPAFVAGEGLVSGEVDFPAEHGGAVLDPVAGGGERGEGLVLGGVGEFQAEHFGVLFRLLHGGGAVDRFLLRLDHGDGKIPAGEEQIVGPLRRAADVAFSTRDDAAVGDGPLFANGMRVVFPSGPLEGGHGEFPAGVGFGGHGQIRS